MKEALQDDVLVASSSGVVDTSEPVSPARGGCSVGSDVSRVILDSIPGEELIMFSLASGYTRYKQWVCLRRFARQGASKDSMGEDLLENEPVPIFLNRRSSSVGSHT